MFKNYLLIAWRNIRKQTSFFTMNMLGFSLSMTCCLLIFILVKHHLSFDRFHKDTDRIYRLVTEMHRDNIGYTSSVPSPLGKVIRQDYTYCEKIARIATLTDELILIQEKDGPTMKFKETEGIAFVEPEFFEIFNFPATTGEVQHELDEPYTAVITESLASKYFGKENPIGKILQMSGQQNLTVKGILKDIPSNSEFKAQIYTSFHSLKMFNSWLYSDDAWGGIDGSMACFVKLNPSVKPETLEAVLPPYVKKFRPTNKNIHHYKLQPLSEVHYDTRYGGIGKKYLLVLSFIGLLLIITACVNFINMATAQSLKRAREVGVKKVLGGSRSGLFWQFILETGMISLFALIASVVGAYLLLPIMNRFFNIELSMGLLNDARVMGFIAVMYLAVTFLAGLYPGRLLSGFTPILALKGKINLQQIGGINVRRVLITSQFVISQLLIISMIVILYQMKYTREADLGFGHDSIVLVPFGEDTTGTKNKFIRNEIQKIAGVKQIAFCRSAPASDNNWHNFIRYENEQVNFPTNLKSGDDQYQSLFELELITGRNLFPSDTVREYLVNEALVRKLNLPSPEMIMGKSITTNGNLTGQVVGVLKDFHDKSMRDEIGAVVVSTNTNEYGQYAIKLDALQTRSALTAIEKTWQLMHPEELFEYQFVDESIAAFYESERKMLVIIKVFTAMSILIGCLGLYGLITFMVANKMKEVSIRKILGSGLLRLLWLFSREFALLIILAFLIAGPLAFWVMGKWLQNFQYRIDISAGIFFISLGSSVLITAITVGYQMLKAGLTSPIYALREQ